MFASIPGLFIQGDPSTNEDAFDHLDHDLGLAPGKSWTDVKARIQDLKDQGHKVKLFFLARHGQGFHNLAMDFYGQTKFDNDLATLNGDGRYVWGPDPELTELGVSQARANNRCWRAQLAAGAPMPQRFFVSPFTRAIDTMRHTWEGLAEWTKIPNDFEDKAKPLVCEDLREIKHYYTCNKRKTKTYLAERFPMVVIEPGFDEHDTTFRPSWPLEDFDDIVKRTGSVFERIFGAKDVADGPSAGKGDPAHASDADYIAITCHVRTIQAILKLVGHRPFELSPGGILPVLVEYRDNA